MFISAPLAIALKTINGCVHKQTMNTHNGIVFSFKKKMKFGVGEMA